MTDAKHEAPAEGAGEAAEAIVRRWANWIIDESSDMDHDDHDAGKRKIRAERDLILSALCARPDALRGVLKRAGETLSSIASSWGRSRQSSISPLMREIEAALRARSSAPEARSGEGQ